MVLTVENKMRDTRCRSEGFDVGGLSVDWVRVEASQLSRAVRTDHSTARCFRRFHSSGYGASVFENKCGDDAGTKDFPPDKSYVEVRYGNRVFRGWLLVDRATATAGGAPVAVVPVTDATAIWVAWLRPEQVNVLDCEAGSPGSAWPRLMRILGASFDECRRDQEQGEHTVVSMSTGGAR